MIILDTNVISEIIKKQPEEPRYKQFGNHRHHRRRVVGRNMSHA